jgi:hypothetical protein
VAQGLDPKFKPQYHKKTKQNNGHWWLTPVILATQEAEIRRIEFEASPDKAGLPGRVAQVAREPA